MLCFCVKVYDKILKMRFLYAFMVGKGISQLLRNLNFFIIVVLVKKLRLRNVLNVLFKFKIL